VPDPLFILKDPNQDPRDRKLAEMLKHLKANQEVVGGPTMSDSDLTPVAIVFAEIGEIWTLGSNASKEGVEIPDWARGMRCLVVNADWIGKHEGLRKAFRTALLAEGFVRRTNTMSWRGPRAQRSTAPRSEAGLWGGI